MRIELNALKAIPGHEMMQAIRDVFSVQEWMRITVNVAGEGFLLGKIGDPSKMMHKLTDLQEGGLVSVEIPDEIEFDVDHVRTRLEATLTAWDKSIEGLKRALKKQRDGAF